MANLMFMEYKIINDFFGMESGYVLDFSNRTFSEFFNAELGINIYDMKYQKKGSSKANLLRCFIELESNVLVAKVLRKLLGYKNLITSFGLAENENSVLCLKSSMLEIINKLENENTQCTDMLENFLSDKNLEELILSIKRDVQAGKVEVCLDRLHTYCMKQLKFFIERNNGLFESQDTLSNLMGKYIKLLESEGRLHESSKICLKSSISILEKFNGVRNCHSFAHDNHLLNQNESIYIFNIITALLRFIQSIEKISK